MRYAQNKNLASALFKWFCHERLVGGTMNKAKANYFAHAYGSRTFYVPKGTFDVSKQKVLICAKLSGESVVLTTTPYIAQICRSPFRSELLFVHYVYQERSV
jgi:hypothetical protein